MRREKNADEAICLPAGYFVMAVGCAAVESLSLSMCLGAVRGEAVRLLPELAMEPLRGCVGRMTISTRRFWARPASLELEAIGC